ncbi:serine/threonine-protein kinase 4 homolog A isoform X2 [Macadamia integrifolia]|uniref:serine/threonine-protein kinase 4 homolog A isoform X2 n=1 Tax=Macadamia integrifolia TaxID=60698 RepID=UPI001C4FB4F8|nr:serine/threonine-protein kinase 4 homolog A isoform X2 [Macadamia integrifolia]
MAYTSEKRYPVNAKDYKLYEDVGDGVSATVYRALCIPFNEIVAIKVLDLEKCNNDLDGVRREVQTMILIDHPNLLKAHCSFPNGPNLWVVMPYMSGGSCLHIMKSAYPEGFEEPVIATLLREVLKALVYLHAHGHIHRDVKAGNILIDSSGAVKLADFGVSACMFDTGDRQRSRNTFVGTPCWMAPEVMQQLHGYDFKADIWSFGITALELAHGHAPFSKYPPMKVLLMTLQNAPPGLDYERDKRFSKSFKEMVAACLVKDPKKRPSSEKLLKHPFFKHARSNEYLARTILDGLAPLGERFRMLKAKEADFLAQNKQEYIRGISAWNFNLEDLRAQAALIQDDDGISNTEQPDVSSKQNDGYYDASSAAEKPSPETASRSNDEPIQEDGLNDLQDVENSLASFPIRPLQALKGYFDVHEDEITSSGPNWKDSIQSNSDQQSQVQSLSMVEDQEIKKFDGENLEKGSPLPNYMIPGRQKFFSGSILPDNVLSHKKVNGDGDRDNGHLKYQPERNYSGQLYRQKRDMDNLPYVDDASGAVVQRKGRFQVTSADLSPKSACANCSVNPVSGVSSSLATPTVSAASVLPSLQYILQQNTKQKDQIIKLIKYVEQSSGHQAEYSDAGSTELLQYKTSVGGERTERTSQPYQISPASAREKELQAQVIHLQQSVEGLVEELQRLKMINAQIERQLISLNKQDARTEKEHEEPS